MAESATSPIFGRFRRFIEPEAIAGAPKGAAFYSTCRPVDVRSVLAGPENPAARFAEGHLPNSMLLPFRLVFCAPARGDGAGGRSPWPDATRVRMALLSAGLKPEERLLFWDAGSTTFAARAVILARAAGFSGALALAGGLAAWRQAGLPVASGAPEARAAAGAALCKPDDGNSRRFAEADAPVILSAKTLLADIKAERAFVIDARSAEAFSAQTGRSLDPPGRIPGAVSRPAADNFDSDGRLKSAERLREELRALCTGRPGMPVHACGSGIAACLNLLVAEEAGLAPLRSERLYPGGWSEWSRLADYPQDRLTARPGRRRSGT